MPENPSKNPLNWVKSLTLAVALILVMGLAFNSVSAGTAYDEGDDRYVELSTSLNGTDWSSNQEANISFAEEIGTRSSIDGTLKYNISEDSAGAFPDDGLIANISISFTDYDDNPTAYAEGLDDYNLTLEENDTYYEKDFTVDLSDLELEESGDTNDTVEITLTVEEAQDDTNSSTDSWTGTVQLTEQVSYAVSRMVILFVSLIPLIVVMFVIGFIFKSLKGVFDEVK